MWNKLIKKSFLEEKHLEFPQLTIYEDIAFMHSVVACANRIVAFNKELINYRFNRPGSLVSTRSSHTINAIKSCICLKKFLEERDLFSELETAYTKAVINHIRAEISYCNDEEYKEFLKEFKALLPNDWQKYQSALRKDYITPEYLRNFIGDKKVMLWSEQSSEQEAPVDLPLNSLLFDFYRDWRGKYRRMSVCLLGFSEFPARI